MQYPKDFPRVELTHLDAAAINRMVQNVSAAADGYRWAGDVLVLRTEDLILVAHVESFAIATSSDNEAAMEGGECP